jgi:hypothetical protein
MYANQLSENVSATLFVTGRRSVEMLFKEVAVFSAIFAVH